MIGVQIEVPGEPKAAQRPQVVRRGKARVAIKAAPDVLAQARVTAAWQEQVPAHLWPLEPNRAYGVRITFGRKHARHIDLDNMEKTILDGLTGLAYPNDHQVHDLSSRNDWTPRHEGRAPSTLIHVRRLPLDLVGNPLPLAACPADQED